jgi:ribonuclease R
MARRRKSGGTRRSRKKPSTENSLQTLILDFINSNPGRAYTDKQLARRLGFTGKKSKKSFIVALINLELSGKIKEIPGGKYTSHKGLEHITGIVDYTNPRFGYVVNESFDHDIWVSKRDMKGALHGDEVEVMITKEEEKYRRPEGQVTKIPVICSNPL